MSLLRSLAPLLVLSLLPGPRVHAQAMPPAIRALMEKQRAGKELTEAEEAQLEAWEAEMEKRLDALDKRMSEPAKPKAQGSRPLPAAAPSREAYLRLVSEARSAFGAKAGEARKAIDQRLEEAKAPTAGAELGALLLLAGGGSASVYATASAVLRAPDDYLAANNLGWTLCGMDDPARGVACLRYAHQLRPQEPLALINLGWAYHHAGQSAAARRFFEQALQAAPQDPAPHLGLGLLAQQEQRWNDMVEHLWLALVKRHSSAGATAFSAGREQAAPGSERGPLAQEKGEGGSLHLPESPLLAQIEDMAAQGAPLQQALSEVESRIQTLQAHRSPLMEAFAQRNRAMGPQGGAVLLRRTFEREMFLLSDIARMTLGTGGSYGKALQEAQGIYRKLTQLNQTAAEDSVRDSEKMMALGEELKAAIAANNDLAVQDVKFRMERLAYEVCRKQKALQEQSYQHHFQAWSGAWTAFRSGARDYMGFTGPVLARIYDPLLNDLQNNWRELTVLHTLRALLKESLSLAGLAEAHRTLKCVPPKPPRPPRRPAPAQVGPKGPDCPLERPIVLPLVVASIELDCTKAKVEFGELLLGSIQRDFTKKETTFGFGVGWETRGHLGASGVKMMVEMTVGGAGQLKDVVVSESAAARGLGIQAEFTFRASLMGGPNDRTGYEGEFKWDATGAIGNPLPELKPTKR